MDVHDPELPAARAALLLAYAREMPADQRAVVLAPVLAGSGDPDQIAAAQVFCLPEDSEKAWSVFTTSPSTEAGQAVGWRWLQREINLPREQLFPPSNQPTDGEAPIERLRQRLEAYRAAVWNHSQWQEGWQRLDKRLRQRAVADQAAPSEELLRLGSSAVLPVRFPKEDSAAEAVTWRLYRLALTDARSLLRAAVEDAWSPLPDNHVQDNQALVTLTKTQEEQVLRLPGPGFYQLEVSSLEHLAVRRIVSGDLQAQCSAGPAGLAVLVVDRRGFPVANADVAAELAVVEVQSEGDRWWRHTVQGLDHADNGVLFALGPASDEQRQALARRSVAGRTDAGGCVVLPLPLPTGAPTLAWTLAVVAGPECLVSRGAWSPAADPVQTTAYVHADRPLYRPGETAHLRGILRCFQNGAEVPAAGLTNTLQLTLNETQLTTVSVTTGAFGTFAVDVPLADTVALGDCMWTLGSERGGLFRIEEFRLPDLTVRVDEQRTARVGYDLTLALQVTYLSGSPAAGVTGHVHDAQQRGNRTLFTTDAQGRVELVYGSVYTGKQLVVEVADASNRVTTCAYTVPGVQVGAATVRLRLDHTLVSLAEGIGCEVLLAEREQGTGPQGTGPLPVELRLLRVGEHGTVIEERIPVVVPSTGRHHHFAVREPGQYRVEYRIESAPGDHAQSPEITVLSSDISPDRSVALQLEKNPDQRWRIGDTAELRVAGPAGLAVMATISGRSSSRVEVLRLAGGIATLRVPITADCVPAAEVVLASAAGNRVRELRTTLPVEELANLRVTLHPDSDVHRPGQPGSCIIKVSTANGQPVEGEVALGIVDEAIYELEPERAPALKTFAIPMPTSQVELVRGTAPDDPADLLDLFDSSGRLLGYRLGEYFGEGMFGSRHGGGGKRVFGGGSGMSSSEAERIRRDFRATAYWNPAVRTDAEGHAHIQFTMPDSLTAWRLTARVVARDRRAGEARVTIHTALDLAVHADVPRMVRRGDHLDLQAQVSYADGGQVTGVVVLDPGALTTAITSLPATVTSGERAALRFPCTVPMDAPLGPTTVKLYLSVPEVGGDELAVPLIIADPGEPQTLVQSGRLNQRVEVRIPALDGGAQRGRLVLSGGPGGAVVDALAYLQGFPYGCTEQTLSRFLPALAANAAFTKAGFPAAPWQSGLDEMTTAGLTRLAWLRHGEAGWGWWKEDANDLDMTAYVAFGLAEAGELRPAAAVVQRQFPVNVALAPWLAEAAVRAALRGEPLPSAIEDAGLYAETLARYRQALPYQRSLERGAVLLLGYAQARRGAWPATALNPWIAERAAGWPSVGERALVALIQWHAGDRDGAARILAEPVAAVAAVAAANNSWLDDAAVSAAWHLRALCAITPQDPTLDRTWTTLAGLRREGRWASTRHTAFAVFALADYVALRPAPAPAAGWRVLSNGVELAAGRFAHEPRRAEVALPAALLAHGGTLTMEADGGSLDWEVAATWNGRPVASEPVAGEPVLAPGPLTLERRYRRVVLGQFGERLVEDLAPGAALTEGDRLAVELTLQATTDLGRVLIEDPRCPGVEPTMRRSGQRYGVADNLEVRDDRLAFFIGMLPHGRTVLAYDAVVERGGTFQVPAARAQCMYDPRVVAVSAALEVRVVARPAAANPAPSRIEVKKNESERFARELLTALADPQCPHRAERLLRLLCLFDLSAYDRYMRTDPVNVALRDGLPKLPDALLLDPAVVSRLLPLWASALEGSDTAGIDRLLRLPLSAAQFDLVVENIRWKKQPDAWVPMLVARLAGADPQLVETHEVLTLLAHRLPASQIVPVLLGLTDPTQRLLLAGLLGSAVRPRSWLFTQEAPIELVKLRLTDFERLCTELIASTSVEWRYRLLGLLPDLNQSAQRGWYDGAAERRPLILKAQQQMLETVFTLRLRAVSQRERERLESLIAELRKDQQVVLHAAAAVLRIQALPDPAERRHLLGLFPKALPREHALQVATWFRAEADPGVRGALVELIDFDQLGHDAEPRTALITWMQETLTSEADPALRSVLLARLARSLPAVDLLPAIHTTQELLVLMGTGHFPSDAVTPLHERCLLALADPTVTPSARRTLWTHLVSSQQEQADLALLVQVVAAYAGENQEPDAQLVSLLEARPAADAATICALFDQPDRMVRWLATGWLLRHGDAATEARLHAQLTAPGELTRYAVAIAAAHNDPVAIPRLGEILLTEESSLGRRLLLEVCAEHGDAATLTFLITQTPNNGLRLSAIRRLAERLPLAEVVAHVATVNSEPVAVALLLGLGERLPQAGLEIVLQRWHHGQIPGSNEYLSGGQARTTLRTLLVQRLSSVDADLSVRLLRDLNRDADDQGRLRGLDLLAELPDDRAVLLFQAALTDPSGWVRRRAAALLDTRGIPATWRDENDQAQRIRGLPKVLYRQLASDGLPALRRALTDPDAQTRASAAHLWWEHLGERCWYTDVTGVSRCFRPWAEFGER